MFLGHGQKIFFKVYVISDLEVLTDSKNLISFSQESSEKMLGLGQFLAIFNFEAHFEPKFDVSWPWPQNIFQSLCPQWPLGLYRFKKSHFLWSGERRENV